MDVGDKFEMRATDFYRGNQHTLKKSSKIKIFQIGCSQKITTDKINTGQYFQKRIWSTGQLQNMFTDKDSISSDLNDGNDYIQAWFQTDSTKRWRSY